MTRARRGWTIAALATAWLAIACSSKSKDIACSPGDYEYCDCPAPVSRGYALCADDGSGYGACDCSGKIPPCAGIAIAASDAACVVAPQGFLTSCSGASDCAAPMVCFPYNAYGPHCSLPCAQDTDCPAPSPGCSQMKVCKLH